MRLKHRYRVIRLFTHQLSMKVLKKKKNLILVHFCYCNGLCLLPGTLFAIIAGWYKLESIQSARIRLVDQVLCVTENCLVTVSLSFPWAIDSSKIFEAWPKSQYFFPRVSIKG